MCTDVRYKGEWLRTMGDAMRVIGADKMVMHAGYPLSFFRADDIEKSCLCPVDLSGTAEALGCELVPCDGEFELVEKKPC